MRVVDAAGVLAWLTPRAVRGVEHVDERGYARTLRTARGFEVVRVTVDAASQALTGDAALARVFDVGTDRSDADERLRWAAARHDAPLLAAQLDATGPIAQPGCADAHEMLYRAIVGQQISVAAATGQLTLLASLGESVETSDPALDRVFPDDAAVAAGAVAVLRGPRAKSEAVARAAAALVDGSVRVEHGVDLEHMRARLLALKGIGPWTAGYVSLRLGDPDVLLLGDVAVRAGAKALGIADLPAFAADCAPYRSQLMLRCWRASAKPSTIT